MVDLAPVVSWLYGRASFLYTRAGPPSPFMSGIARHQRTYEPTGHRVSLMDKPLMFRAYEYTAVSRSIIEYYPVLLERYPLSIEILICVGLLEACFTTLRPSWK